MTMTSEVRDEAGCAGLLQSGMWRSGCVSPRYELCSLDTGLAVRSVVGMEGRRRPVPGRLRVMLLLLPCGGFLDTEVAAASLPSW